MRESESKIDPFFVTVGFSRRRREQSVCFGKGLVEACNKVILQHNFKFDVLVILSVKGIEQKTCFGLSGERRKLIPTLEGKRSKFKRIFFIRFSFTDS